jgi:hypothetical protein
MKSGVFSVSPCAAPCRPLSAFGVSKGQEKGNVQEARSATEAAPFARGHALEVGRRPSSVLVAEQTGHPNSGPRIAQCWSSVQVSRNRPVFIRRLRRPRSVQGVRPIRLRMFRDSKPAPPDQCLAAQNLPHRNALLSEPHLSASRGRSRRSQFKTVGFVELLTDCSQVPAQNSGVQPGTQPMKLREMNRKINVECQTRRSDDHAF